MPYGKPKYLKCESWMYFKKTPMSVKLVRKGTKMNEMEFWLGEEKRRREMF